MRRGVAIVYAITVLVVVGALIFGVTQFRSVVTHSTELASQEVNAQAAAEAGFAAALAELQANALFRTHESARIANADELAKDPLAAPKLSFGKAVEFEARVAAAAGKYSGLERVGSGPGDYTFNIGRGLGPTIGRGFDGTFRVKVAPLALAGFRRPVIAVEARGRFDQRAVSVVTLLEAGGAQPVGGAPAVDAKYPALASLLDDYLLVDGELLDPGLGLRDAVQDQIVLSMGALYGAQGVQLGGGASGSRLSLKRLGGIASGAGVWLADAGDVTFWDPARPGEASAPYRAAGGERPDPNAAASDLFEATGGRVADHRHGGKLALPDLASGMERTAADHQANGGIDLGLVVGTGTPDDVDGYEGGAFIRRVSNYTNPYGATGDTIELCFGRPSYVEGVTGDADPLAYSDRDPDPLLRPDHPAKAAKPAAFLYAKGVNLVVWGCPDRDVSIYTDRDIYVAGDFNQSPWHHQIYTSQDPAAAGALDADGRATRYLDPVRFSGDDKDGGTLDEQEAAREGSSATARRLDQKANAGLFQERKLARLTAKSRVWLDYRWPSRLLANELIPWLSYQLAAHLATEPGAPGGAPTPAALAAALAGSRYGSLAEVSRRAAAVAVNVTAPLSGFRDASGNPTPVALHFVREVLALDPGSADAAVKDAAGKAVAFLMTEVGSAPAAGKIHATAERLVYRVLAPLEKRNQSAGIFKIAQMYHEQVFVGGAADPAQDRHAAAFASGDPRLLKFYLPEMTVNAQLVDGATRLGEWDRATPQSARKIQCEIGNAPATGVYLKHRDGEPGWAPLLTRVYGSEMHLRQSPPDPALTLGPDARASTPPLRRRVFARSQGRWIGAALKFGLSGDAGLTCTFRTLLRRESVLSAERAGAGESLANWP